MNPTHIEFTAGPTAVAPPDALPQVLAVDPIPGLQWVLVALIAVMSCLIAVLWVNNRRLRSRAPHDLATEPQLDPDTQSRLDQAERMQSLGALAGGIAHDFNNLLVGVVCNAEVLQTYHDLSDEGRQCLDGILKAAATASDLSRKMLVYAGRQAPRKEPHDLNDVVRRILSLAESGLVGASIGFHASPEPAYSNIDRSQIEQVAINLLTNAAEACKATGRPGGIQIRIGYDDLPQDPSDPLLFGAAQLAGRVVFIEVQDSGVGIPASEVPKIFEPFHSSQQERGRGLGLSIVYGHVLRHDGLIRVRSRVGEGTTIRILLPECASPSGMNAEEESIYGLDSEGCVLIVEEDDMVRNTCVRCLNQHGWEAAAFGTGDLAISYLKENPTPDCVLVDVVMRGTDGWEVVRQLHELGCPAPVVVTSGYTGSALDEYNGYPNVVCSLSKPFTMERLIAEIGRATKKFGPARSD